MKKLIALMALALTCQTHAYDLSKKFGVGGSFGFPVPVWGNNFNNVADTEWGASVYGRYHFDSIFALDLGVSKEGFKDTNMDYENINLLGIWRINGSLDLTPVLGLGAGVTRITNYSPGSSKLSLLGRAGLEYGLSPYVSVGALLNYQYVSKIMGEMPTEPAHIINPQVSLTWYFGGTNENEKTDEKSREEKAVETAPPVAYDQSDVISTEESATAREEVRPDVVVEFDVAKANVKPQYIDQIKKVAAELKDNKNLTGFIEGHADDTGPAAFNNKLSLQRAEAVRKKLVEYGVENDRLKAEGFGEDRPIADNSTIEGRSKNRRSSVYISVRTKLSERM